MIEICIFLFILFIILKTLRQEAKIKVANCTSVHEAIEIRKNYDTNCKRSAIIIYILFCLYVFIIAVNSSIFVMTRFIPLFLGCYGIFKGFVNHPVSNLSIKGLTYKYYVLFLRGFDTDNYNSENRLYKTKKKKKTNVEFSEVGMQKNIETYCCNHTIALGMPLELFSPIGCERIYCEPETWKQDVRHLINDSLFNIVLLNDRPSCLYELDHCFIFASKTYCIVYDRNIYENLRGIYDMFPPVSIQEPFFFRLDNAAITYAYNPKDFAKKIEEDLKNLRDEKVYQNFKKLKEDKNAEKNKQRIKIGCFLILLSVLYFYLKYI